MHTYSRYLKKTKTMAEEPEFEHLEPVSKSQVGWLITVKAGESDWKIPGAQTDRQTACSVRLC